MNADSFMSTLGYWSPVLGLITAIGIPALFWLWDLKNNHVHTIEENSKTAVQQGQRQIELLSEIKGVLAAK